MKNLYILSFLVLIVTLCCTTFAKAEITVRDYMSYDFLDKQGYSQEMLRLVELNKAKTFGEEMPSQWPSNKFKRAYRKVMAYIDPADDSCDFGTHEINVRSTWWDY